jgi:hypothetical protein
VLLFRNLKIDVLLLVMSTIVKYIFSPVFHKKKRFYSSLLDAPPPPIDSQKEWAYGSYSWIATVEAKDDEGGVDRTFIGYSQNMDITTRTYVACDRLKKHGTTCGEPQMTMRGGECDEVIFMKSKDGKLIPI